MSADDKCTLCGLTRSDAHERSMGLFCPTAVLAMHVWPAESCQRCTLLMQQLQQLRNEIARAEKTRSLAQEASSRDALEKQALRQELFQVKVQLMGLRQQG